MSEHIALNPIFGGGYGAYWIGPLTGTPAYDHVVRLNFYPTEAHNGYLDIINDLGALGGICLLGYLLVYLGQSLRVLMRARVQGALYVGLLFEQLIANLSESRWLNVLCVEFVIMTLATVAILGPFTLGRPVVIVGAALVGLGHGASWPAVALTIGACGTVVCGEAWLERRYRGRALDDT